MQGPGKGYLARFPGRVQHTIISHNNFDLARTDAPNADNGINACITMAGVTNLDIVNNRLNGGGYSIYFDGANSPSVDVTNNVFAGHVYGAYIGEAAGSQTFSGNVFSDTASPPPAATTGNSSQSGDHGAPAALQPRLAIRPARPRPQRLEQLAVGRSRCARCPCNPDYERQQRPGRQPW